MRNNLLLRARGSGASRGTLTFGGGGDEGGAHRRFGAATDTTRRGWSVRSTDVGAALKSGRWTLDVSCGYASASGVITVT